MNDNQINVRKDLAEFHGIQTDESGLPTAASLRAYHNRTNERALPLEAATPVSRRILKKSEIPVAPLEESK